MRHYLPDFTKTQFLISLFFAIVFFVFFTLGNVHTNAFAASDESISAYPTHSTDTDPRTKSWFIYTLPSGEKRTDSVTVVNTGTSPITLKVYAVDSTTASNGSFALAAATAPKTDVGSWVSLSTSEVTLGPKERKDISFTISIPLHTTLGDHSGGIIFEETNPQKLKNNGLNINLVSRVGVRIYETVPGEAQLSMKISDFHYSVINNQLAFSFIAENTGTVHISPTGVLEIHDMFGRTVSRTNLNDMLDTFVPGKPLTINVPTQTLSPILGWDTANVFLYYSPTQTASASVMIVANPWATFGILFIVLLIIAFVISWKFLFKVKGKSGKVTLAPHIWFIVGGILLGTVVFSWIVSFLLTFLLTMK